MARARNIKPGFFKNEELGLLPMGARLLFIGLWTLADREGRLEDRPARIAGELFPYDRKIGTAEVDSWLDSLASSPEAFIVRYAIGKSKYLQISNFGRHQNPHVKETPSVLPKPTPNFENPFHSPDSPDSSTGLAPGSHQPRQLPAPPDSLIPDSLIPKTNTCASSNARLSSPAEIDNPLIESPLDQQVLKPRDASPKNRPPSGFAGSEQDSRFTKFWGEYWLRKAKKDARRAFDRHVATPARFDQVLAAVRSQKPEMLARPPEKRPYAATWLNGERWEDESASPDPIPPQAAKSSDAPPALQQLSRYVPR